MHPKTFHEQATVSTPQVFEIEKSGPTNPRSSVLSVLEEQIMFEFRRVLAKSATFYRSVPAPVSSISLRSRTRFLYPVVQPIRKRLSPTLKPKRINKIIRTIPSITIQIYIFACEADWVFRDEASYLGILPTRQLTKKRSIRFSSTSPSAVIS